MLLLITSKMIMIQVITTYIINNKKIFWISVFLVCPGQDCPQLGQINFTEMCVLFSKS